MKSKVEHIGIAVKNMEKAIEIFSRILGKAPYKEEIVESEGVRTVFFDAGNVKIELLEALNEHSPIAKFIERRGEGIHHIAFGSSSVEEEMHRLSEFSWINAAPKKGADNMLVNFIHPKGTAGVLIEFCEEKSSTDL